REGRLHVVFGSGELPVSSRTGVVADNPQVRGLILIVVVIICHWRNLGTFYEPTAIRLLGASTQPARIEVAHSVASIQTSTGQACKSASRKYARKLLPMNAKSGHSEGWIVHVRPYIGRAHLDDPGANGAA